MRCVIFDTETTDLIHNSLQPLKNQPRVIEFFALTVETDDGYQAVEVGSLSFRCNPGVPIHSKVTKITGISDDDVKGLPKFSAHAEQVIQTLSGADLVVAHNLSYDQAVIDFEFERIGGSLAFWPKGICTVESTEHFKGHRLNLAALHSELFGEAFENAHSAEADVRATARCFLELLRRGEV